MKKHSIPIIAVLFMSLSLAYGQPYTLSYKYVKGETYRYKTGSNATTVTDFNGQERQTSNELSQQAVVSFDNTTPEGNLVFISQFEEMTNKANFNGRDTIMEMKNLLGKRSRIILSPTGKILNVKMIDSIVPDRPQGDNRPGGPRQGGMMFRGGRQGANALRFFYLPSKAVSQGDTWQINQSDTTFDESKNATVTNTKINYKLGPKDVKNGIECLKITYKGNKTTLGKTVRMGNESTQDLRSESKGTIWFDAVHGITVAEDFEENTQSTRAMTGDRAMVIPSTTFMKGTYTLVK
jgi:hypothetical protein